MNELALASDACVLVASDMHLGAHDPGTARFFIRALERALPRHSHLLLLGDLFEAWPGDDCQDAVALAFISQLQQISRQQELLVMVGNRDFLLDSALPGNPAYAFSQRTGARMLPDPTLLQIGGQRLLLMHGDSLCTDDLSYQQMRKQWREPQWQRDFLTSSLAERERIARSLRDQSEQHKQAKDDAMMDVNQHAVDLALDDACCEQLLHGHTHRPAHHEWLSRHRYVLPDWDEASRRGGFASVDANAVTAISTVGV